MQKSTSISLGQHFESFIREQLESGRFSSTSEVFALACACSKNPKLD